MGIVQGKNRASREKPPCGFCNVDLVGRLSSSLGSWWRGGFQAVCHGLWGRLCWVFGGDPGLLESLGSLCDTTLGLRGGFIQNGGTPIRPNLSI